VPPPARQRFLSLFRQNVTTTVLFSSRDLPVGPRLRDVLEALNATLEEKPQRLLTRFEV
jgi:hypothetical protein